MSDVHTNSPIRIAVVDDDISVRELVSNYINTLDNCKVMIQAGDGKELLDKLFVKPEINLLILDIRMDGMNGYETAHNIRKDYPAIRILFYTMCNTELALSQMAASGGHGLIKKGKSIDQFVTAIKTVMSGYYFFPEMTSKMTIQGAGYSVKKNQPCKSIVN